MISIKLDFIAFEIISAFKRIKHYYRLIESQMEEFKEKERVDLEALPIPKNEEEYQTDYAEKFNSFKIAFEEDIPRLLNYSFIVMLYSELEFRIKEMCRELKQREKIPIKLNDLKGDLLEKLSNFLKIVGKNKLSDEEKKELKEFTIIRNCVVHNNGFLENLDDKKVRALKKIAKDTLHMEISGNPNMERIQLSSEFCYSRIEFFVVMFKRLFEDLDFGPLEPIITRE